MTPEQEQQFNEYGCACRCLIELSKRQNKKITKDEFTSRYANRYSNWSTMFGVADKPRASDLAKELNLCSGTQDINDKDRVKEIFNNNKSKGILVFTEKSLVPNRSHETVYHCLLLTNLNSDQWELFHPDKNGKDYLLTVSDVKLQSLLPSFLVLT